MVYYVKNEKGMVIGYATRKDALLAILSMPSMRYDLRMECAYKDRGCRNRAFTVQRITDYLNAKWGEGTFVCEVKDSYRNMKEKILPHMYIIDRAKKAMTDVGVTPDVVPIRGGTDGARLSYEGLPCPNLSTGGLNFHSIHEFIPVFAMEKMVEVIITLANGAKK